MESQASATDLVAQVDPEVDRIDGLITVTAREGKVLALVSARGDLPKVRRELIDLNVPDEMLEVQVIGEALLSYPVTDERLRQWLDEARESGTSDVALTVKGPRLSMTARGVGKVVLFLVIGYFALTFLMFILLMVHEWWVGL